MRMLSQARPQPARLAYTMQEVAEMLGLSYHTVFRLVRAGRLKTIPGIRTNQITHASLQNLLTNAAETAPDIPVVG